jgi:hypothetical protein
MLGIAYLVVSTAAYSILILRRELKCNLFGSHKCTLTRINIALESNYRGNFSAFAMKVTKIVLFLLSHLSACLSTCSNSRTVEVYWLNFILGIFTKMFRNIPNFVKIGHLTRRYACISGCVLNVTAKYLSERITFQIKAAGRNETRILCPVHFPL